MDSAADVLAVEPDDVKSVAAELEFGRGQVVHIGTVSLGPGDRGRAVEFPSQQGLKTCNPHLIPISPAPAGLFFLV